MFIRTPGRGFRDFLGARSGVSRNRIGYCDIRVCRADRNQGHANYSLTVQAWAIEAGSPSLAFKRDAVSPLVMHEQRQQQNNRERNANEPEQCTSTETHVSLHIFELHG
jgi:hypothetical protein